jgi:hypothetical protein
MLDMTVLTCNFIRVSRRNVDMLIRIPTTHLFLLDKHFARGRGGGLLRSVHAHCVRCDYSKNHRALVLARTYHPLTLSALLYMIC